MTHVCLTGVIASYFSCGHFYSKDRNFNLAKEIIFGWSTSLKKINQANNSINDSSFTYKEHLGGIFYF